MSMFGLERSVNIIQLKFTKLPKKYGTPFLF